MGVHGWTSTKALQAAVRERIESAETSIFLAQRWLAGVSDLECPICLCAVIHDELSRRCHTWHYCHNSCYQQWEDECARHARDPLCSLCNGPMMDEASTLQEFLTQDIRSHIQETRA